MKLGAAIQDGYAKFTQFVQGNWALLLPLVLGFAGIYLLLPQVRRSKRVPGALFAALALLIGGWYTIKVNVVLPEKVLFYAFAGTAIVAAAMLITQKNPVHAALSFALVVLSTCGLFLLQAAPFLMAATIIIYAGAIVVTFLFVIMLAQQAGTAEADQRSREPFLASLAGFVLMGAVLFVLQKNYSTQELDELLVKVRHIAEATSADEVIEVMGDPAQRPPEKPSHSLVDDLTRFFPGADAVANLEDAWQGIRQPHHLTALQANSRIILALGDKRRMMQGSLTPSAGLPLSTLSGTPAYEELNPAKDGKLPERLPAQNVAALGRSLFTDYALPVLLAAMLLLVATIGAIAIAGRRAEGLR
jgi:NADH-quinone oxidoreductase subunit J